MAVQLLISFLVSLSIVASGLLLANAQKVAGTPTAAKPAASQPAAGKPAKPVTPQAEAAAPKPPKQSQPLLMELSTAKDMYHSREDMMVKAELWAVQPVTLCLYRDHPEANFSADVFRAGYGKLDTVPNVVKLERQDLMTVDKVTLNPGEMHRLVFNVKKLVAMPPSFWKTGEYRIQLKFYLCGKTEGGELAIPSQGPLHLLVLE